MLIFEHLGGLRHDAKVPTERGVWHRKNPLDHTVAWWVATHYGEFRYGASPLEAVQKLISAPAILRMAGSVSVVWPRKQGGGYQHGDQMAAAVGAAAKMMRDLELDR